MRATQFFEFLKGLADISMVGGKVRLPHVLFQPMAADDVASGVCQGRGRLAASMARSKWAAKKQKSWMIWFGGAWPRSTIPAKLSLTHKRLILGRNSAREHWFPAMTRDSARRVSKTWLRQSAGQSRVQIRNSAKSRLAQTTDEVEVVSDAKG